jgi:hypothetical protein
VGYLVLVGILIFVVWMISRAGKGPKTFAQVAQSGARGRALVLQSSMPTSGFTMNGRRWLRTTMTLDIEVPGQQPYQVTGSFLLPRGLVEAVPGSSLEVAVDMNNRMSADSVSVLGPGGFTGPWLNVGPPNPY